jgi:hypothetical protein
MKPKNNQPESSISLPTEQHTDVNSRQPVNQTPVFDPLVQPSSSVSPNNSLYKKVTVGVILFVILAVVIGLLLIAASSAKKATINNSVTNANPTQATISRNYISNPGAFSVYFIKPPNVSAPQTIAIPSTTISAVSTAWASGDTARPPVYSVRAFDLPAGSSVNINNVYNSQLANFKLLGTVNSNTIKNITLAGRPAVVAHYSVYVKAQTLYVDSLITATSSKLYLVSTISNTANDSTTTTFINSFLPN